MDGEAALNDVIENFDKRGVATQVSLAILQPLIKGRRFKEKEITLTAYPVFMESCGHEYVPLLHHLLILQTHAYYTRPLSSLDADYAGEIYSSIEEAVHEACEEYKVPWRVIGSGSDGIASRFKHQSMSTPRSYAVREIPLNVNIWVNNTGKEIRRNGI